MRFESLLTLTDDLVLLRLDPAARASWSRETFERAGLLTSPSGHPVELDPLWSCLIRALRTGRTRWSAVNRGQHR
jgi:hypothetical protein